MLSTTINPQTFTYHCDVRNKKTATSKATGKEYGVIQWEMMTDNGSTMTCFAFTLGGYRSPFWGWHRVNELFSGVESGEIEINLPINRYYF